MIAREDVVNISAAMARDFDLRTEKTDAERRNEQAAYLLRNMLGTGVIDIPKVLGVLENRQPQLRLVEGTAA